MKIKLELNNDIPELEILIIHRENDTSLKPLLKMLTAHDKTILCNDERKMVKIKASDIFYIESIDKKTFIYTVSNVYLVNKKLYELVDYFSSSNFCQVSKFCIINVNCLKSVEPLLNSRLEATLENGEKVIVTRKYLLALKEKL